MHSQKTAAENLYNACIKASSPNLGDDPVNIEVDDIQLLLCAIENEDIGSKYGNVVYNLFLKSEV